MTFVVDASIALCWCLDDEASTETDALLDRVGREGGLAPVLWRFEICNVLIQAERRGRIPAADVAARLELIDALPVTIDRNSADRAWRETLALARVHRLTSYDAAYLELALRTGLPLATRDKELIAAAKTAGVKTLP